MTMALVMAGCFASAPRPAVSPPPDEGSEGGDEQVHADVAFVKELEALAVKDALEEAAPQAKAKPQGEGLAGVVDTTQTKNMCRRGRCPNGFRCGSAPGRPRKVCYAAKERRAGPTNMFEVTAP